MTRTVVFLVLALLAAACGSPAGDAASTSASPTSTTVLTSTSVVTPPIACGATGATTQGPLGRVGDADGDAAQITAITLATEGDCERLVIDFVTRGGAPATRLTPTRVELLAGMGIIRIGFDTSVQSTAVAESVLEGEMSDRAYVVRGLDGRLFVDVLLNGPVQARVDAERNPARLVVEYEPFEGITPNPPSISETVVVTAPSARDVDFPLLVTGYARTFEANVVVRLEGPSGVESEAVTTAAAYLETWGEFQVELSSGPTGSLELLVGSPEDGTLDGVRIPITAG